MTCFAAEEEPTRDVSRTSTLQMADSSELEDILNYDTEGTEQVTIDRDQIYWDADTTVVPIYDSNGFIIGYTDSGSASSSVINDSTTYGEDGAVTDYEARAESEPSADAVWVEVPEFDDFGNFIGFKTVLQEPDGTVVEQPAEEDTSTSTGGTPMEVPDFDEYGNFIGFKTIYV